MKRGFSALIPDGESAFALPVLRCLSRIPGLEVHVLSDNPRSPIRFSRYRKQYFSGNGSIGEERAALVCNLIRRSGPDVVIPVDFETIHLLSVYGAMVRREAHVVPMAESGRLELARNKGLLAAFLRKEGLPCPPTVSYRKDTPLERNLSSLSFPVVVKPVCGGYGRGIRLFDDLSTLRDYLQDHKGTEELIIQSYVNGHDIDCSVLCLEGRILAHTIQKPIIPGYHLFRSPLAIEFLYDERVYTIVEQLVRALRWSGIAHIDLRYDTSDDQVKIIEANPRYWGSLLGSLAAGVNFPYLSCLMALGIEFPKPGYKFTRYCGSKAAIRLLARRLLRRGETSLSIRNSSLSFAVRDPGPDVLGFLMKKLP